jgi:predicted NBD/HSP70 family sugar kinase
MPTPKAASEILDVAPATVSPIDHGFRPVILAYGRYQDTVRKIGGIPVRIGIERENGFVSTFAMQVSTSPDLAAETSLMVNKVVKFLLWSRGGWRIYFEGPAQLGEGIRTAYRRGGPRSFDIDLMSRVYERPFEVAVVGPEEFPEPRERRRSLGGHVDGCRIGFDLGASDYKIAAVKDGVPVFSREVRWAPGEQADPVYHDRHIRAGLDMAATRLPRVDAIGGSSAGIFVNNQVRTASLFRSVPAGLFEDKVKPMFLRIATDWGVPFEVINDGEVTALAGRMSLGETAVLGVAMGSSQAAGYLNSQGQIPGWLDELAFTPVDLSPQAPVDEWSGDHGVGANYFSQQAVGRLAAKAGLTFPESAGLPERLADIQRRLEAGDAGALSVFETIGVYLGYTIPWYETFYDFRNLLVLGRVLSGRGGNVIVARAEDILRREFPETADRVRLRLLDETSRRVGQAVAAASLPSLDGPAIPLGEAP